MAALTIAADTFEAAAKVTVAFLIFYSGCLVFQGVSKIKYMAEAKKKKTKYDRYGDPRLLAVDRIVGNILEWSPVFLGLFWVSMIVTEGATATYGWIYLGARALYAVLAVNGGIAAYGPKVFILLATVPAYLVLIAMAVPTVKALFL